MRHLPLTLALLASSLAVPAWADSNTESPVGTWKTIDDKTGKQNSVVQIYEENGELKGKVLKIIPVKPGDDPNGKCDKCPGDKKGKPIVGLTFLWGLKKDGEQFNGGQILDPEEGNVYSAKMKLTDGGKKLEVRGYLGIALLGRTQTWLRD